MISLIASAGGWLISLEHARLGDRMRFQEEVDGARAALVERLSIYENMLHGAVGLFAASDSVERNEWRAYIESVSVNERFPGLDALGFIQRVKRSELDAFQAETAADGMAQFVVKPVGGNDDLLVIKFLEPEDRHQAQLGRCLNGDPTRLAAAERGRDTGQAVVSGRIRLNDDISGFLMMLPVYRFGSSTETLADRHENFVGLVYARVVMERLVPETFRQQDAGLRILVFDGETKATGTLVYDSGVGRDDASVDYQPLFTEQLPVAAGGRIWLLDLSSTPAFDMQTSRLTSLMAAIGGLVVSLLLFAIVWSLSRTRERALVMARDMTAALRGANEQLKKEVTDRERAQQSTKDSEVLYHSLVENLPLNIFRKDLEGRFTFANQRLCNEAGKALEEILGKTEFDLFPAELAALHKQEEDRIVESGDGLEGVQEVGTAEGDSRFVQVIKTPLRDGAGNINALQGISWDVTEKHRMERELERERELLRTLLDNVPDRIYFKDEESRFLRVSRAMCELFQVTDPAELVGKSDFDFFGEEHARQAYDDERRIIRTGRGVIGLVEREDLPDGTPRWASTTKMPMRNAEGRVVGTFGISRDVTQMVKSEEDMRQTNERLQREIADREQAQQSMRDSEVLYHSLVESLPMSILRKDLEGRFTFANQRFCRRLGKPLEEILGKSEAELFPAEVAARHQEEDQRILKDGVTLEEVQELRLPGLPPRYVQVIKAPLRGGSGTIIGLQGISWDVTDKHRTEQELQHQRDLLHTLLDNVPDRIYFKDRQSRILRMSRAHAELFKLKDPNEAVGKTDFDFFTGEHAQQAFDDEQRIIKTGKPIIGLVEKETLPDNEIRWASTTKMPLRNERGEIVGTFGITRDITEMKKAAEALKEAKEAAEEASRTKSQFLANMSHELRTPLNSIIGFSNIMLKNKAGNLGASEISFQQRILSNGKHLLELINQILDLSKIEARKVELQISPVQVDQLVRETIAEQEGLVRERPVQLLCDLPEQVAPILTDPDKLKQVLINLIGNSLKFTEKGSVTLRVIADADSQRPVRIDVVDTGIGILQEKLGAIFQAFQQAEATTARRFGGTGLGLTISQALCRLMGHQIQVTSKVGHGSTFSICLGSLTEERRKPAASESAATRANSGGTTQFVIASVRGKRVLVIDDEVDSRLLLRHTLEEFGCDVFEAVSGEEGLRVARQLRPDLITVDLMMPRMTGSEVVGAIKSDPDLKHIPVVVVSIVSGEHRGHILGAVDLLQKPIVREELLATLQRHLSQGRPQILVVDDEEDSRELMRSLLEPEGYLVGMATNGKQAQSALNQVPYDLVLLDLMMPEMDGFSFLRILRSEPRYRNLPVVVVTAKDLNQKEEEELRANASDVVRKSAAFNQDLKSVLRRLCKTTTLGNSTEAALDSAKVS